MEFNVSSAELLKAMTDVAKAVPAKTSLPILEYLLFVLKGDKLEITASDQELTLRTVIDVDSKEDGSIAAPAGQLIALFKALPDTLFKALLDTLFKALLEAIFVPDIIAFIFDCLQMPFGTIF